MLVTSVQWSEWTVKWREWATYICISSLSWASPAASHPLEHHRAPGYTIQQVPISWFTHGSIFIFIGISGWHICGLVTKSCLTLLWPPWTVRLGCSVHEISQTRLLVWVAISFPGNLPDSGVEPISPALQADSLPLFFCCCWASHLPIPPPRSSQSTGLSSCPLQ